VVDLNDSWNRAQRLNGLNSLKPTSSRTNRVR
jgi:hypothetical protein